MLATAITMSLAQQMATVEPLELKHDEQQTQEAPTDAFTEEPKFSKNSMGDSPAPEIVFGCILVLVGLVTIWKNEKKSVEYTKCIGKARQECKPIIADLPLTENEFCLVACSGTTQNTEPVVDHDFDVSVDSSYRLIRTAEMY
jgi:hypothetical protein